MSSILKRSSISCITLSALGAVLLAAMPQYVLAGEVWSAKILECGELIDHESSGAQEEKQTIQGFVTIMDPNEIPKFKPGCPKIKAAVGVHFGISVKIIGSGEMQVANLTTRVTHPKMKNPVTGAEGTVDQWPSPMNINYPRFAGWEFNDEWELVPGNWRIEILDGDEVIAAKDFEVEIKSS